MFELHYRLNRLLEAIFGTKDDVCNPVTLGNRVLSRIHIRMVLWSTELPVLWNKYWNTKCRYVCRIFLWFIFWNRWASVRLGNTFLLSRFMCMLIPVAGLATCLVCIRPFVNCSVSSRCGLRNGGPISDFQMKVEGSQTVGWARMGNCRSVRASLFGCHQETQ